MRRSIPDYQPHSILVLALLFNQYRSFIQKAVNSDSLLYFKKKYLISEEVIILYPILLNQSAGKIVKTVYLYPRKKEL